MAESQGKHTPGPCGDRHEIDRAYSEAHERIRNAAPDLLEACRYMIEKWETLSDESSNLMCRSDLDNLARGALTIRAAIAKAEGGAK